MAKRKAAPFSNSLSRIASRPEQAEALLQAGLGSALSIARASVETLMKQVPGLSGDSAQRLHQRASALAVLAARHYREQRLTASEAADQPWQTGLRALVDGPTFDSQFSPNWNDNCPPGSIEATTSPAAYLTALFQWATQVIEPLANVEEGKPIFLAERRPDLAGLILDNHSLERVEPTVGIVNEILEGAARKHLDDHNLKERSVDDALLEARYPFGLPFERYMSQINRLLQDKGHGLGDLVRQLDPEFPYFCRGGLHSLRSDEALQLDTALGPEQRALLLEAAYFPRGARRVSARSVQTRTNPRTALREPLHALQASFYRRHYGVAEVEEVLPLSAFCLRTGLNQDAVESLLSIQRYAPVASPNVPGLVAPSPAQFGSVYINAGLEPTIGVTSVEGGHSLSDWVHDHFDRMQRMIRLSRWLELSFGETDQVLDAALQAEYGSGVRDREISENTLRALGLFRRLRRDFKVSAEDFAALLQGVALYARGSDIPQFDRVFNDPALFSEPLVLDGSAFSIVPGNETEYRKVHHLCAALGLDYETYLYLARYIAQAWGDEAMRNGEQSDTLYWSHAVVSAFYRLARLPAWLGLSSIEALALLQLVGERGHQYVARLARTRLAVYQHSGLGDTLSVIQSLADAVQWCRGNELSVSWLYQHLMPLAPVAAASDRELDLLRQINGRMLPVVLGETAFRDAGLPMFSGVDKPTPIDWLQQLQDFVSPQGLIRELSQYPDIDDYEGALREHLARVMDNLELENAPRLILRVFQLVMDARSGQQSLVWESLASTFGGSAELNQEVLAWAGGSGYQLLGEVLRLFNGDTEPLPIPVGDDVLALFARIGQRMGIVEQLSLSPLALRTWRLHPDWFEGAGGADGAEITFARLYLLTQYRYLLAFTKQAEKAVLDYLKLVNSLPPELTEQDLQMIREDAAGKVASFTGFGIRDILETALEITEDGFVTTLRQLDHLVRVRQICTTLTLGSDAALELSRLRSNSLREAYRSAAEKALGSLLEQGREQRPPTEGELGQSEASWMVVDTEVLVAKVANKAHLLLTVRDFLGRPMPGITVTWTTDFATLGAPSSITTDENGQVENDLLAGQDMGTAQVVAHFGLDRQILAPLILIDCEEATLSFKDPVCAPMEALAGNLAEIEYRLRVEDDHGNPGRDRMVEWSTDLGTFERPQTRTDVNGFTSARLRSLSSGQALVIADLPVNGEQHQYEAVTFIEQEYFQYVRFSGAVAATQPTVAMARVVNLDGTPERRVTVLWKADTGGFVEESAKSITDDDGIAVIHYLSPEAGEVTLTVNAIYNNQNLLPLSSACTKIHELPRLVEMEPAEQYFVIDQPHAAKFNVRLEPAAAGYPVTWWADDVLLATTYTSADGAASYQRHFNQSHLGEQIVSVRSLREGDQFDFLVRVVAQHDRLVVEVDPDDPGIVLSEEARLVFAVDPGLSSELLVTAERHDGTGDDEARLTFTLGANADPTELGVVFDPPLGQPINCDPQGRARLRIDCSNAAFLPNSDPHNNHIRLLITSNLGVTVAIWVGLRYLLDLKKSALHLLRWNVDPAAALVFYGRIKRRNGQAALALREGARSLKLTLEGVTEVANAKLTVDQPGSFYLQSDTFLDSAGGAGTQCRVEALGDLVKRVEFVGGNLYDVQGFIDDAVLTLDAVEHPGLIEVGQQFEADHGDTYQFTLSLRNAIGPVAGVWLSPTQAKVNGMAYAIGAATDASGQVILSADSAAAVLAQPHGTSIELGPLSLSLDLRAREWAVTTMSITMVGLKKASVRASFNRREQKRFLVDGFNWTVGFDSIADQRQLTVAPHPESFSITVDDLGVSVPGSIVQIYANSPTYSRVRFTGETGIGVPESPLEGDAS